MAKMANMQVPGRKQVVENQGIIRKVSTSRNWHNLHVRVVLPRIILIAKWEGMI